MYLKKPSGIKPDSKNTGNFLISLCDSKNPRYKCLFSENQTMIYLK